MFYLGSVLWDVLKGKKDYLCNLSGSSRRHFAPRRNEIYGTFSLVIGQGREHNTSCGKGCVAARMSGGPTPEHIQTEKKIAQGVGTRL